MLIYFSSPVLAIISRPFIINDDKVDRKKNGILWCCACNTILVFFIISNNWIIEPLWINHAFGYLWILKWTLYIEM
ncbi:hypothetical protein DERP_014119 [Dermatophagoides pteronyssinus]|uniref:Uncharacterized protein n=1 Tax=Dermatophagoides pteronyssinus TaxID=6956 RepID=A0ABQ8IXB2_DERPT|nr:hypothetical protein DERP_014119 [Dermatophagoides pteronyssinus]